MEGEKLVIVTGYDIFKGHEEKNASWEAVRILPDKVAVGQNTFEIKKLKVEVKYDEVDKMVEEIWKMQPHLVIHVGVHGFSSKIKLEKCAINGFPQCDYSKKTLCEPIVCLENSGKCDSLSTEINVDKIVSGVNANYREMYESSCDVGKYLCGYIYLKSLDKDPSRALFIHVPCIDKPFTSEETSAAILKVLEQCLISQPIN